MDQDLSNCYNDGIVPRPKISLNKNHLIEPDGMPTADQRARAKRQVILIIVIFVLIMIACLSLMVFGLFL